MLLIHRTHSSADDWVLPGGTPRPGESMAACARREVREETGLHVDPARVAFVLEVVGPEPGPRTVDIVFSAAPSTADQQPAERERGLRPVFVPVDRIQTLDLGRRWPATCAGCSAIAAGSTLRTWPICGARAGPMTGAGNHPMRSARTHRRQELRPTTPDGTIRVAGRV